jgi:hypothetical protein
MHCSHDSTHGNLVGVENVKQLADVTTTRGATTRDTTGAATGAKNRGGHGERDRRKICAVESKLATSARTLGNIISEIHADSSF